MAKYRAKSVELFHALADDTRLSILDRLRGGEQCVCELTDALHSGQSRLSFHLKVLKDAGLIKDRPDGRWMYYSISPDAIDELEEVVGLLKEGGKSMRSNARC